MNIEDAIYSYMAYHPQFTTEKAKETAKEHARDELDKINKNYIEIAEEHYFGT